ncbi:Guanylate kinase [Spironucleus salmonicida]|uniref:guanylate kinase n=1 Tax=Spironucleus salmonicida TaxID=348837 RepID=V6LG67_9EUKA|nr:Guanylate kinase [Spironucleus salmonicida]|eukprot:EST43283.1 Guanylate kinase [Spironucleus salmonicida]
MGVSCSGQRDNRIIVINGVTAVGKSTLYKLMMAADLLQGKTQLCISHTTREPRPHETHGVDYNFVDARTFEDMIAHNKFLEYSKNHNNYYGTSFQELEIALQQSNVVLDIDYKGSKNLKNTRLKNKQIFILITPPDQESFIQRLRDRGTETEDQIQTRIKTAKEEMLFFNNSGRFYDYKICNDNVEKAAKELEDIVIKFLK